LRLSQNRETESEDMLVLGHRGI